MTVVSDADLIDLITSEQTTHNAAEAAQISHMLDFVDRARRDGEKIGGVRAGRLESSAAAHELSLALTLPVATIENKLATARRVRSGLPAVWSTWHEGRLSIRKVTMIVQSAERLIHSESLCLLDHEVIDPAEAKTPGQLRSWLDRFVQRCEADVASQRHQRARRDRRVWIQPADDGMAWLSALIPELEAAAIDQRLDSDARCLPSSDPRTHDQARADFLTDLLLGACPVACDTAKDGTTGDTRSGPSTTIGVIVPIQSLMGLSEMPGELADRSASVPASLIRSKAIEPGTLFWRLLTDEVGNLLDATSMGRFAPEKLGQAIRFRDGTSAFPTSTVPADRCDIDHSTAWPAPTTASNLGPLHRRAHNLKTAGLLSMRQPEPGVFEWTTRTGHHFTRSPDPLPSAGWAEARTGPTEGSGIIAGMAPQPPLQACLTS